MLRCILRLLSTSFALMNPVISVRFCKYWEESDQEKSDVGQKCSGISVPARLTFCKRYQTTVWSIHKNMVPAAKSFQVFILILLGRQITSYYTVPYSRDNLTHHNYSGVINHCSVCTQFKCIQYFRAQNSKQISGLSRISFVVVCRFRHGKHRSYSKRETDRIIKPFRPSSYSLRRFAEEDVPECNIRRWIK